MSISTRGKEELPLLGQGPHKLLTCPYRAHGPNGPSCTSSNPTHRALHVCVFTHAPGSGSLRGFKIGPHSLVRLLDNPRSSICACASMCIVETPSFPQLLAPGLSDTATGGAPSCCGAGTSPALHRQNSCVHPLTTPSFNVLGNRQCQLMLLPHLHQEMRVLSEGFLETSFLDSAFPSLTELVGFFVCLFFSSSSQVATSC